LVTETRQAELSEEVLHANVLFYRQVAQKYDRYESCGLAPFLQRMLERDIDRIDSLLSAAPARRIRCLDCGGGTGNLSVRLLQRGWDVTVVDASREMLDILEDRCRPLGLTPTIHHGSLEEFLVQASTEYDVIAFGSVLHHLYSYLNVLELACQRLRPGGFLYTNFDPVPPQHPFLVRAFDTVDTLLAKLRWDRNDVIPGIRRRIRKLVATGGGPHDRVVVSPGDLAEYHVPTGVDDQRVVGLLSDSGLTLLEHVRFPVGRTTPVRALNRWFGVMKNFKLLAHRPVSPDRAEANSEAGKGLGIAKTGCRFKVVSVHNYYRERGGEDIVAESERELLSDFGHTVLSYSRRSSDIEAYGWGDRASLALRTVWAWDSYRELLELIGGSRPEVAHFHNTLPLISPAAYYACRDAGVPVVQTLHNYRLFCPAATFFRRGRVCEECVEHSLWRSVRYGCYRGSRTTTAAASLTLSLHRWKETWSRQIDVYVALTEFARSKFVAAGLPAEKIVVKPNFVHPDPGCRETEGDYAVYVGRLCQEKGLTTLLDAWSRLPMAVPLRIVGEGPQRRELESAAERRGLENVRFLGWQPPDEVMGIIKKARFLLFTSEWYETFGRTAIEAFACGVPVVAARLGAMEEIVEDQRTGLHFSPGDPQDLADKIELAWSRPDRLREMGREARREFESKYTRERSHRILLDIYRRAISP